MAAEVIELDLGSVPPELQSPVLLPPEETILEYISHRVHAQYGRGVLTVWFAAADFGGVAIPRYYNVKLRGNRKFSAFPRGSLVADFRRIFTRPLGRLDRFPIYWLKGIEVLGELRTVTKDNAQEHLGDGAEYSVVGRLIKSYK